MKSTVLVVGGAGYIGSHMVKMLGGEGHRVVSFDNLCTGHRDAVLSGPLFEGDVLDTAALRQVFSEHAVDIVMHFAAFCYVGESVVAPQKYYRNNVVGTLNLLDAMVAANVGKLVFSSTCATYGVPNTDTLDETHPQWPVNPYGRTKLTIEQAIGDYAAAYALNSVSLRYFNAAGCDAEGKLGERHEPETHLIPLVLREALRVRGGGDPAATGLRVLGGDFDTPDGTCIRDYVHVEDLCRAHLAAATRLASGLVGGAEAYNLGTGCGVSVKEVIAACSAATGIDIRYRIAGRRPGDPPKLVANAARAARVLGWSPRYAEIESIVATAWNYMLNR